MRNRVYRKPTGWYIDFTDVDGRRRRKKIGSKAEAQLALAAVRSNVLCGKTAFGPGATVTLREFKDDYMAYVKSRQRVFRRHEASLKNLLPVLGDKALSNITLEDIVDYKTRRLRQVKGATINRELACLRHLLNVAKKFKVFFGENPVTKQECFFAEPRREPRLLTDEERDRLLDAIDPKAPHLRLALVVEWATGLRKSEVLGLRWSDVDFEGRRLIIRKTKAGKVLVLGIGGRLFEELARARAAATSDFVFPGWKRADKTKAPVKAMADVKRAFQTAREKAGLRDLTFHDLRHGAAVRLARERVPTALIKEQLGHASLRTTEWYLHFQDEDRLATAEALDKGLESLPKIEKRGSTGALAAMAETPGSRLSN